MIIKRLFKTKIKVLPIIKHQKKIKLQKTKPLRQEYTTQLLTRKEKIKNLLKYFIDKIKEKYINVPKWSLCNTRTLKVTPFQNLMFKLEN